MNQSHSPRWPEHLLVAILIVFALLFIFTLLLVDLHRLHGAEPTFAVASASGARAEGIGVGPDRVCRAVVAEQLGRRDHERPFLRWLILDEILEREQATFRLVWTWWITQLSTEPFVVYPRLVHLPGGIPAMEIDIREYNWTPEAWAAVAERNPYYRSPWVSSRTVELGNEFAEYAPINVKATDDTVPFIAAVRADWLFRETLETARSPAYYDLLFGARRYLQGEATKGTADVFEARPRYEVRTQRFWHGGGPLTFADGRHFQNAGAGYWMGPRKVKVGEERVLIKKGAPATAGGIKFVDFPRDQDDWNEFFGVKDADAYAKRIDATLRQGVVVAGSNDDPRAGSMVARHNRAIALIPTPNGLATRSFDAAATADGKDFLQESPNAALGKLEFDAGEFLATLPNGGQACLIVLGDGKRQEFANGSIVHNFTEARLSERPRYADVRTPMHCVGCHGPQKGFIPPRDLVRDFLGDGVDVKFAERAELRAFRAFYDDFEWKIEHWRAPYGRLMERASKEATGAVVEPAKLTEQYFHCRDVYDAPVAVERQAAELGMDVQTYQRVMATSARVRLAWASRGKSIPREVWEKTEYEQAALLFAATGAQDR